jgi:hypothetical protein
MAIENFINKECKKIRVIKAKRLCNSLNLQNIISYNDIIVDDYNNKWVVEIIRIDKKKDNEIITESND